MDGDTHVWSIPLYVLWCLKSYLYHEMDWRLQKQNKPLREIPEGLVLFKL